MLRWKNQSMYDVWAILTLHDFLNEIRRNPFGVEDQRPHSQGSELRSQPWAIRRNSVGVEDGRSEWVAASDGLSLKVAFIASREVSRSHTRRSYQFVVNRKLGRLRETIDGMSVGAASCWGLSQ